MVGLWSPWPCSNSTSGVFTIELDVILIPLLMTDFALSHHTIIECSWANESNFRLSSCIVRLCLFTVIHLEIQTGVAPYSSRLRQWLFDRIGVLRFDSWFTSSRLWLRVELRLEFIIFISTRSSRRTSRSVYPAHGKFELIRICVELRSTLL